MWVFLWAASIKFDAVIFAAIAFALIFAAKRGMVAAILIMLALGLAKGLAEF